MGTVTRHISNATGREWHPYVLIRDVQAAGTNGQGITSGDWVTRVLNEETSDVDGIATLGSNQIVLSAGTYLCRIYVPGYKVEGHKSRLQNVTAPETVLLGSAAMTSTGFIYVLTHSMVIGRFTIVAGQSLEVQHQVQLTNDTNGGGFPSNFGVSEIYTMAEFWKIA